jgi:hypothetical protein
MNQAILNKSRNDKFLLVLDIPIELKKRFDAVLGKKYNADTIQFTTFGSPVPAVSVPSIDVPYDGQVYKASSLSRPSYQPLNIRFFVDNGYQNYWLIWQWLNMFNNAKESTSLIGVEEVPRGNRIDVNLGISMKDLVSIFSIYALDEYNNKIVSFTYNHAFPVSLGEINYSHQDPSEITSVVGFAFNQLEVKLLKNVNEATC